MREARRSQWPPPLASRATKQTARKGAPDSVSRSVAREGAQAAARNTVKRGAHAAAPAPQASLTVSRQPSHPGCGKMRRLRRCAPRLRSPSYDLRRAPRILPHFASNAIRGGFNQRFPYMPERILFLTGKLAEKSLHKVLAEMHPSEF